MPPIAQNENFHVAANSSNVLTIHFQHHLNVCYHFVITCQHSCLFVVPHLSSFLVLSMCVFVVDKT